MMLKYRLVVFSFMVVSLCASAQDYVWSSARMDGSRTGCSFVAGPDIKSAIGQILDDGTYQAPNGTIHNSESSLAAVAAAVIAVQPEMADVKSGVGRSEEEMLPSFQDRRWMLESVILEVSASVCRRAM